MGDIASGHGIDIEHIATGAVAGGTYGAVFAATGNAFAAGAASGAVSSAFSQSWNYVATGGASGFDLAQVGDCDPAIDKPNQGDLPGIVLTSSEPALP